MTTTHAELHGQTWLITGAGSGLGRATAQALAARGATVALLGKTPHTLEATYDRINAAGGPEPLLQPMNLAGATVSDYHALADGLQAAGGLHGVVHCAARFDGLAPLAQHGGKDWAATLHVNLTAPLLLSQALVPLLVASQGQLVFIGDRVAAERKAFWGAYGVAKAGVEHLAALWAAENGDAVPVDVWTFTPPPMQTALRQLAFPSEPVESLAKPEAVAETLIDQMLARS